MEYRQNRLFRPNQFRIVAEVPSDVFFAFMTICNDLNSELRDIELVDIKGYKISGDDLLTICLEDFNRTFGGRMDKLLKRLGVDV
ncbi:MAG: hypothetical protein AB7G87_01435 [Clostridia bacterium]